MSFDLIGFDFIPAYKTFGVWVGCISNAADEKRCLFSIHHQPDEWRVELLWLRIV